MINLKNYYLHGTAGINGKYIKYHTILLILDDHKLATAKSMGFDKSVVFMKLDELCLCDRSIKPKLFRKKSYLSSYEIFVSKSPTLVFNRSLEVYRPKLITLNEDETIGTTNMYDEVRHEGDISLDHLEFITYPISNENEIERLEIFRKQLLYIKKNHPGVQVFDLLSKKAVDVEFVESQMRKALKKHCN